MKAILNLISAACVVAIIYMGCEFLLKDYFNEYYYFTPNFISLNANKAVNLAKNSPVTVQVVSEEYSKAPAGTIFLQDPKPKQVIKKNRIIRVWVSKGSNEKILPNVSGVAVSDAKSILQSKGFAIGDSAFTYSDAPENNVLATSPNASETVSVNQPINFLVSTKAAPLPFTY